MKKKYLRAIAMFFAVLMFSVSAIPCAVALWPELAPLAKAADEGPENDNVVIAVSSPYTFKADGNNVVRVEIGVVSGTINRSVTVRYHTENRSAISGVDYSGTEGSVVLTPERTSATIAISTYGNNPYTTTLKGTEYSRYFAVILDSATDAAIDQKHNEAKCVLATKMNYSVSTTTNATDGKTIAYMSEYANIQIATEGGDDIEDETTWKSWSDGSLTINTSTTKMWVNMFSGMAKPYVTFTIDAFTTASGSFISSDDLNFKFGNYAFVCGKSDGVILSCTVTPKTNSFPSFSSRGYELNEQALMCLAAGKSPYNTNDDYWDASSIYINQKYAPKNLYYSATNQASFFPIESYNGVIDIGISGQNTCDVIDRQIDDITVRVMLRDETAPKIVSYYLDDSSLERTGKLRLIVRYSEPVYSAENAGIYVTMNDTYQKLFRYVDGNYTDTQYFEYDANADNCHINIRKFTPAFSESLAKDLAFNRVRTDVSNNKLNTALGSAKSYIVCRANENLVSQEEAASSGNATPTINYRYPDIAVKNSAKANEGTAYFKSYNNLTASMSGTSQSTGVDRGILYYQWTTSDKAPTGGIEAYESHIEVDPSTSGYDVSLAGSVTRNLSGTSEMIGGVKVMKYYDRTFAIDGRTYRIEAFNYDDACSYFVDEATETKYPITGVGPTSVIVDNKTFTFNGPKLFIERSGTYYLHLYGISEYGLIKKKTSDGYKIDGATPFINVDIPEEENQMRIKTFTFTFYDRPETAPGSKTTNQSTASGLRSITMKIRTSDGTVHTATLMDRGSVPSKYSKLFRNSGDGTYKFISSVDDRQEETIPLDPVITELMGEDDRREFFISFVATDMAGNTTETESIEYVYDKRDGFTSTVNVTAEDGSLMSPIYKSKKIPVYDLGESAGATIGIVIANPETLGTVEKRYLTVTYGEGGSELIEIEDGEQFALTVDHTCFVEITPGIDGIDADGNAYSKISSTYRFYFTKGENDETANYVKTTEDLVLSNRVFRLSDVRFTYLGELGSIPQRCNYGAVQEAKYKFVGGSTVPSFSSKAEAEAYATFMEYKDMYLIQLTDGQARLFQGGNPTYKVADGEERTPQAGQFWIRYKRSTCMRTNSPDASEWAFYYYNAPEGTVLEDGIDLSIALQNTNLKRAISSVVSNIMNFGRYVYLIAETDISPDGSPYIAPEAMHILPEEITETMQGNPIMAAYAGDGDLYRNTVIEQSDGMALELPLATNLRLNVGKRTQIYFRSYGVTDPASIDDLTDPTSGWLPLKVSDGMTLASALGDYTTGIYTILELDASGVRRYDVYVDKTLPYVQVIFGNETDAEGNPKVPQPLDGSVDRFYSTAIHFLSLTGETDPQAYVALFNSSKQLIEVRYADDLAGWAPKVGSYYVQIGDRSGNIYSFALMLSDTKMTVEVKANTTSDGFTVSVSGRTRNEIYRYRVTCNNEVVSTEFPESMTQALRQTFRAPGEYEIVVEDIYGNVETVTYSYKRMLPVINWYYQDAGGEYREYNENDIVCMAVTKDSFMASTYYVQTSMLPRFRVDPEANLGNVVCEIEGAESVTDYEYNAVTKTYTFKSLKTWSLKVYFDEFPDAYVTYYCTIDNTAPKINATYIAPTYSEDDFGNLSGLCDGETAVPQSLAYEVRSGIVQSVSDGDIITGNGITVEVGDDAGIRSVSVKRNGDDYAITMKNGTFRLEEAGAYVITAVDKLGNTRVFRFTNTALPSVDLQMDGESVQGGLETVVYGNTELSVLTAKDGDTDILVHAGDAIYHVLLRFRGGMLTAGRYIVTTDDNNQKSVISDFGEEALYLPNDARYRANEWYTLGEDEDGFFTVRYNVNRDGQITYSVLCNHDSIVAEVRYKLGSGKAPDYVRAEMSKECSDFPIYSNGQTVETNREGRIVFVGDGFSFDEMPDEKIRKIAIAYAKTAAFDESAYATIYQNGIADFDSFDRTRDGLYSIRIVNIYGNVTEYVLSLADSFFYSAQVTYADGAVSEYVPEAGLTVYTNAKALISAFGEEIVITVNGAPADVDQDENAYTVMLNRAGTYDVSATDRSGVNKRFRVVIGTDLSFAYDDAWLSGFNEKALMKSEGYTNRKLSVEWDEALTQVYVVSSEGKKILYDVLSSDRVTDLALLFECIGCDGDGVYTVGFRDKYGDLVEKTIHYRETPALLLSRSTLANGFIDPYDLMTALERGFYSSNALYFETAAEKYVFTVTSAENETKAMTLPYTLEFDSDSGNGSFAYTISYIDAYGFEYDFEARLLRTTIPIDTGSMDIIERDGVNYTRDNVQISFDGNYTATVAFGANDPVPYKSGTPLYRDGTYRFEVTDVAGNRTVYRVTHDSVIKYTISGSKNTPVMKGGVSNESSVSFRLNDDDTGYLLYVILNGVELKNYDSRTFTKTGHWELIVADDFGNRSYFDFYLVNHSLKEFTFDAPDGYTVSEVWYAPVGERSNISAIRGDSITLTKNGTYAVVMTSAVGHSTSNFTVTIDDSEPDVELVGCVEGEETPRIITLKGLQSGDFVVVRRNNEVIYNGEIRSAYDLPEFEQGGTYEITVTNEAGATKTLSFVKKQIANTSLSIVIIIFCLMLVGAILIGLIYRNRSRTDK